MDAKIKIVLIDDDEFLTKLLSEILEPENFEIQITNDSLLGAKLVSDTSPDVVLLDWMMPGKDGIQVLKELKENDKTKNIPVFMLTTKNMLNEVNHLFTAGADDYFCKPFNPALIASQIRDKMKKYKQRKS